MATWAAEKFVPPVQPRTGGTSTAEATQQLQQPLVPTEAPPEPQLGIDEPTGLLLLGSGGGVGGDGPSSGEHGTSSARKLRAADDGGIKEHAGSVVGAIGAWASHRWTTGGDSTSGRRLRADPDSGARPTLYVVNTHLVRWI